MNKNIEEQITHLSNVLYEKGEPTDFGCSQDELPAMKLACKKLKPYRPFCAVKGWTLWEVELTSESETHTPPILLVKADYIIEDEMQRFPVGGWVRSTAIIDIHNNCIFQTNNTSYILMGSGTKKAVGPSDVNRIV